MTFEEFHQLLLENSGVTNRVIQNQYNQPSAPASSFFFQPYQSKADPFIRASTLLTGPAVMSFIALESALVVVYFAVKSVVDLAAKKNAEAKKSIVASGEVLLMACGAILAAFLNPIINLIDLIGGGINTLTASNTQPAASI
jgi:hypothetical protein